MNDDVLLNDELQFDDLEEMLASAGDLPIAQIAQPCSEFVDELKKIHPIKAAATFGALLAQKSLQFHCLRLEVLVHLCIVFGRGSSAPMAQLLTRGYAIAGQACGHLEDPPEDIFVGNIYSRRGNYRVLDGVWETGTFFLQRFVNLVDELPATDNFFSVANSIHALLAVSDHICERMGLKRNELGNPQRSHTLPKKLISNSSSLRKVVQFELSDLEHAGIDIDDLLPFVFDPMRRNELLTQSIGHSGLEAQPLAIDEGKLYLLLPTAVSVAIRRFFLKVLGSGENRPIFLGRLGAEYARLFDQSMALGTHREHVHFSHLTWGSISCMQSEIDKGRFLNLIFFMDTLDDFESGGLVGTFQGKDIFFRELDLAIASLQDRAQKTPEFRGGITLFVSCGIGRPATFKYPITHRDHWTVEFLSAADYCTLSRLSSIQPLDIWRILQMETRLAHMNVQLQKINGFLNLYAWADSLEGHLIPHASIPDDVIGKPLLFAIAQNSLLDLRHNVAIDVDSHVEPFVDGSWRLLLKEGASHFEEDDEQPIYGHLPFRGHGKPLGACVTSKRCWWYELASPPQSSDTTSYDRWKMVGVWLAKAVAPLEKRFSPKLGPEPILWRCIFEQPHQARDGESMWAGQDPSVSINTALDHQRRTIEMHIGPGFDQAVYHPDNIAERSLVAAFVGGVAQLAGETENDIDLVVSEIVPNTEARHLHVFAVQQFRDCIASLHDQKPLLINRFDDAAARLGMGWLVRRPEDGGQIAGKGDCLEFLNALVRRLEDDLCLALRAFDRTALITALLQNYECASAAKNRWHKTASAILALRNDKSSALKVMRRQEYEFNGVTQSTRNLLEIAICESPTQGGVTPGDLDISQLMATISQIFLLGGWSDLVRWDMLEPPIVVRALGDVHAKQDFMDTVLDGFGSASTDYRFMASVRSYAKNLQQPNTFQPAASTVEPIFLSAWEEEFGTTFDACRIFLDRIEDWAIEKQEPVFQIHRSQLAAMAETETIGNKIVDQFCLAPRPSWRELPSGFEEKDIAPWRFRRRLGLLRRPILQLTLDDDPLLLVAPGLVREGFVYTVSNYYYGTYPDRHLGAAMKKYAGYARNREGMGFNQEVANCMTDLGWQTQSEVALTKILAKALDRNYGDVDVLAFDAKSGRVLVMECKDLQFRKTYGEIAEQLNDFRGEINADGKRDLLRKHLDRIDVLRSNESLVKRYLQLKTDPIIESHLVFRHPVPMQFSQGEISRCAKLHILGELESHFRMA